MGIPVSSLMYLAMYDLPLPNFPQIPMITLLLYTMHKMQTINKLL